MTMPEAECREARNRLDTIVDAQNAAAGLPPIGKVQPAAGEDNPFDLPDDYMHPGFVFEGTAELGGQQTDPPVDPDDPHAELIERMKGWDLTNIRLRLPR